MDASILFIENEQAIRNKANAELGRNKYEIVTASDQSTAIKKFEKRKHDVVVIKDSIPGNSINDVISEFKRISPNTPILLMVDHDTRVSTIQMLQNYIFSWHTRPLDFDEIHEAIQSAVKHAGHAHNQQKRQHALVPMKTLNENRSINDLVKARKMDRTSIDFLGVSKSIQSIRQQIMEVGPTDLTILIRGESGVGKGIVARLIHAYSGCGKIDNFISINCPAIPETLFESELFGHEAGSFTGADKAKPGRLELARNGTAFLDEIGEIPSHIQVKLLQAIEQKEFYHIGGQKLIHVDVRFVTATNADLEKLIEKGQYRADLYYRLNEYAIHIPPLRERIEDIPVLVEHFLKIYNKKFNKSVFMIPSEVMAKLMQYLWPGNVRELETTIRRFVLNGNCDSISEQLELSINGTENKPKVSVFRQNEARSILAVLTEVHWNRRHAAERLGISYNQLRRRIDKYDLKNTSVTGEAEDAKVDIEKET